MNKRVEFLIEHFYRGIVAHHHLKGAIYELPIALSEFVEITRTNEPWQTNLVAGRSTVPMIYEMAQEIGSSGVRHIFENPKRGISDIHVIGICESKHSVYLIFVIVLLSIGLI